MPSVLQWTVNGLKTPLSNLRTRLRLDPIDSLVLQKAYLTTEEGHLTEYVTCHSKLQRPVGKLRTSNCVRKTMYHTALNLAVFSPMAAEYAAVTLRVHGVDASVIPSYVRPGVPRDPRELLQVHRHCAKFVFLCGDFNSHHES